MDNNNLDDTIQDDLDKKNRKQDNAVKRKIKEEAKKQAKEAAKKATDKAKNTLFKQVGGTAFSTFFAVFVIIFMLIGIISFITTMPGLVQENIMNKVVAAIDKVNYFVNGSDYYLEKLAEDTDRTAQKEVLKYLDEMGIDPVGFGFAAFYTKSDDGTVDYDLDIGTEEAIEISKNGFNAFLENAGGVVGWRIK